MLALQYPPIRHLLSAELTVNGPEYQHESLTFISFLYGGKTAFIEWFDAERGRVQRGHQLAKHGKRNTPERFPRKNTMTDPHSPSGHSTADGSVTKPIRFKPALLAMDITCATFS